MRSGLSVLMPTYNGMPFVRDAIASLLTQSHHDFRLIVQDDGSADGTWEYVQGLDDARVEVFRHEGEAGISANWNRAVARVPMEYFALCHQDDMYEPAFLERMLDVIRSHGRAMFAHCRVQTIDERGRRVRSAAERYKQRYWPGGMRNAVYEREPIDELRVLRQGNYILMPTAIYRTSAVRDVGTFDESLRFVPDWQYWLRGLLKAFTIVGVGEKLVRYRRHAGMESRRAEEDLSRYREEMDLARWIANEGKQAGAWEDSQPEYTATILALVSEMADRLRGGDSAGANRRLQFAFEQIPGFAGSPLGNIAKAAAKLGRVGGLGMAVARAAKLSLPAGRRIT